MFIYKLTNIYKFFIEKRRNLHYNTEYINTNHKKDKLGGDKNEFN